MADLESVIAGAVADSGISDSSTDNTPEADTLSEEVVETSAEESVETPAEEAVIPEASEAAPEAEKPTKDTIEKSTEKSQLDKDLEELGMKAPKPGERENRLPYSRVRKIAENFGKKVEARFTGELATLKDTNAKQTTTLENFGRADHLAANDPDRFIKMLSTIHPGKYDKFLANAGGTREPAKEPAKAAESAQGPRPQPDVVFEDKTRGYSPEQHDKLLEWVAGSAREQAVKEAEERFNKRFGKIEESYNQRQALNAQIPIVKEKVNAVYETWGKELVDKHEDEIVTYMQKNPKMSTEEAVARILVPKVRAERNTMRNDLIKETKTRTAAAARVAPGTSTASKEDSDEPKSLEDVIRGQVAKLRR